MTHRPNDDRDGRASIREALESATRIPRPDTRSLRARVPAVLAEASRRAVAPRTEDTISAMIPMARWALPRFAAVAALFVVLAAGLHWNAGTTQESASRSLESLIFTGEESDFADDLVLESILGDENG